jgi:hypothetical protein
MPVCLEELLNSMNAASPHQLACDSLLKIG